MNLILILSLLTLFQLTSITTCFSQQESNSEYRWYKGNTHTHTTNSDGDSAPEIVAKWYHDHRYNLKIDK